MKNNFGSKLSVLNDQDWLSRLKENMPYPEKDILMANLPETVLSRKLQRGEPLKPSEIKQRKKESADDIFVFAGFVEPGKH